MQGKGCFVPSSLCAGYSPPPRPFQILVGKKSVSGSLGGGADHPPEEAGTRASWDLSRRVLWMGDQMTGKAGVGTRFPQSEGRLICPIKTYPSVDREMQVREALPCGDLKNQLETQLGIPGKARELRYESFTGLPGE